MKAFPSRAQYNANHQKPVPTPHNSSSSRPYQQYVVRHRPIQTERKLGEEHEYETEDNVLGDGEKYYSQADAANEQTDATNERIHVGEGRFQPGGEIHAARHSENAGRDRDDAEYQRDSIQRTSTQNYTAISE